MREAGNWFRLVGLCLAAVLLGGFAAIRQMPRDIFPSLGIPTIYVAQPYGGIDPAQMEGFLTYYYEYHFLYITGIEHVESKSIQGASIMKLQFHPGTDMSAAMAEKVHLAPPTVTATKKFMRRICNLSVDPQ